MLTDVYASDNSEYLPTDLVGLAAPAGLPGTRPDPLDDEAIRAEFECAMAELEADRDRELAAIEAELGIDLCYRDWLEQRDAELALLEIGVASDLREILAHQDGQVAA